MTVTLYLTVEEVDFIINVLGSVPTLQTVQAGKLQLIPKLRDQTQASIMEQKAQDTRDATMRDLKLREFENVVLQTKEPEQDTLPFGSVEQYRQRQAQENIDKQHEVRRRLDSIERGK